MLNLQGHYHEEVNSVAALNLKQKYYQGKRLRMIGPIYEVGNYSLGYPGQPEIDSSHFIEQSPGYGHPYLPGNFFLICYLNFLKSLKKVWIQT